MPSIQGEARPPAFGPHSKFGGGRLYLDSYLSYIFAIFSLKPHKKRSHPMHSLEILFSPTFWSSSNLGKAVIAFLFLFYALSGLFYFLPYCPDDKQIKQMLQTHKMFVNPFIWHLITSESLLFEVQKWFYLFTYVLRHMPTCT